MYVDGFIFHSKLKIKHENKANKISGKQIIIITSLTFYCFCEQKSGPAE